MIINLPQELFEQSCLFIAWKDAADYLKIPRDEFKGEMWDEVDFVKLLNSRLSDKYTIYEVEMADGYGQGEGWLWYKSFTWSSTDAEDRKFKSTRLAKYWFDDNYIDFDSIEIK